MCTVTNKTKTVTKVPLKDLIFNNFTRENGKFFYSIEVTPKNGLNLNFNDFKTLPLFVDITWIKNENLKTKKLLEAPAFDLARIIESSQVVNSVTCYNLTEDRLDEILRDCEVNNFTILRGDLVDKLQKFKFANELVAEVRRKVNAIKKDVTVFAGGHPESHVESKSVEEDLKNLKRKVDCVVDVFLTQVVFSADKFLGFVGNCREIGISSNIPIIPGLYIPHNFNELNLMLRITKVSMEQEIYETFESLKDDKEGFKEFSLTFMTTMIRDIQKNSQEFIRGFHFFTMNNFEMVQRLVKLIDFTEEQNPLN